MLKRKFYRKIFVTTAVLFSFFLMNFLPEEEKVVQKLEYVYDYDTQVIYLIDQYNMVARTNVAMSKDEDTIKQAKKMLELLILEGESEAKLPSGFKGIIPSDTKIIGITYKDGLLKINFSKELLNVDITKEEQIIEAIVFSMTEIEGVEKVIIYVEDQILSKLPKSKINLPSTLDRSFGINKEYTMDSYKGVNPVTIYYVSKYNEDYYYYVPVTKYVSDSREKIKIIIEQLSSSPVSETNLMSFLNSNTKLLATQEEVDSLFLVFNDYIFSDMESRNILEEVIYSISLSVKDNYDVKEVVFKTEEDEIYKSVLKTLE